MRVTKMDERGVLSVSEVNRKVLIALPSSTFIEILTTIDTENDLPDWAGISTLGEMAGRLDT
jgi:hypothetical protein